MRASWRQADIIHSLHCAWLRFSIWYSVRRRSSPAPRPRPCIPSPRRDKMWHFGRGKRRRCYRTPSSACRGRGVAAGCPWSSPAPGSSDSRKTGGAEKGDQAGGEGPTAMGMWQVRSFVLLVREGEAGEGDVPTEGAAAGGSVRRGNSGALCARAVPEGSICCGEEVVFQEKNCLVCALVRHFETSFVPIVASRCWHRCSLLLRPADAHVRN